MKLENVLHLKACLSEMSVKKTRSEAAHLIEPSSDVTYKLTRTQLPLTHGRVRTCQASQGRTFKTGVTLDMTKMKKTDEESWWLNLYVMLSRATALKHLLLFNAPKEKKDWDALQPPPDLVAAQRRLEELAKQTLERKQSARASASQAS